MNRAVAFIVTAVLLVHDWYPKECRPVPCEEITKIDCGEVWPCYHWHGDGFSMTENSPDCGCFVCLRKSRLLDRLLLPKPYCMFFPKGAAL